MFDDIMVIGMGNSKITAIRKNRDKNGSCAECFGSNPLSNGDHFSWSSLYFLN